MAARQTRLQVFQPYEQALMGIGLIGLCAALSREAGAGLNHLCMRLAGELVNVMVCLLMGEGRLLATHVLDFQRLLDFYCFLASVAPMLHCLLGLQ